MKPSQIVAVVIAGTSLVMPACQTSHAEQPHEEESKIVVTSPLVTDVVVTQPYVCQIRSQKQIEVRALEEGYLEQIAVREGQLVRGPSAAPTSPAGLQQVGAPEGPPARPGDVLFKVIPTLYKAGLDTEKAEVNLADLEYQNTLRLHEQKVVSIQEVYIFKAKLDKAKAKLAKAEAELNFAVVRAPFDGIIDRLQQQQGSLVGKGDLLTMLFDNSVMWVYFNVPEARYYEFKAREPKGGHDPSQIELADSRVELVLADGHKFDHQPVNGNVATVVGKFNNETGNIPFRVDFPNPERLLRHGQTGTVLVHRTVRGAVVIPQRATFEVLDKLYVYVVGSDHVVRRREIVVAEEKDDIFVVKKGLDVHDKIILEGVKQVNDGKHIEFEFVKPEEAVGSQKNRAE